MITLPKSNQENNSSEVKTNSDSKNNQNLSLTNSDSSKQLHTSSSNSHMNNLCTVDPSSFISYFPIIPIPTEEWMKSHIKSCNDHIEKTISTVKEIINELDQTHQSIQIIVRDYINKTPDIIRQRFSFKGRGLNEYRVMFFLIHKLHKLQIKYYSLSLIDTEKRLLHFEEMNNLLSIKKDYSLYFVSVNLRGFSAEIPSNQKKIESLDHLISLIEKHIVVPKFIPPPDNIADQLIYPTSTRASLFTRFERSEVQISIDSLLNEFREMTDEQDEMAILMDLAFTYAWRSTEFPFLQKSACFNLPTFYDVRVSLFQAPYIPDEYQKMHIGQLIGSNWPYKPIVDDLMKLFFLINPMEMAKVLFDAMGKAGPCIDTIIDKPIEIDFDTIFPLILVCILATGILSEPKILYYVATIPQAYKEDSICQLGSSYAEAIITHILSLDENELLRETQRLDSIENENIENKRIE